jgi:hypothetical protein
MSALRGKKQFVIAAMLMVSILALSSAPSAGPAQQLAASQEMAVVGGGFWCDFNDGVGIGLGVATLFGCVWCGAGAAVAGIVHAVAC